MYLVLCSYFFVMSRAGDPIQLGIIEWLCMIAQFGFTVIVGLIFMAKATDKKMAKRKFWTRLLIVFVITSISLFFDEAISNWLWSFRKDVIQ
jgi:uncharacterized membrane protein YccC